MLVAVVDTGTVVINHSVLHFAFSLSAFSTQQRPSTEWAFPE